MSLYAPFLNVGLFEDLAVGGGALRDEMLRWLYASDSIAVLAIGVVACAILLARFDVSVAAPVRRQSVVNFRDEREET